MLVTENVRKTRKGGRNVTGPSIEKDIRDDIKMKCRRYLYSKNKTSKNSKFEMTVVICSI